MQAGWGFAGLWSPFHLLTVFNPTLGAVVKWTGQKKIQDIKRFVFLTTAGAQLAGAGWYAEDFSGDGFAPVVVIDVFFGVCDFFNRCNNLIHFLKGVV